MAVATANEAKVIEIAGKWGKKESFLVEILQDIQAEYRYLPPKVLGTVARAIGVPVGQVYHLATFFRTFSLKPKGKHVVCVCMGTACHIKGAPQIADALSRELKVKVGETTKDGQFTLEQVRCLGCCGLAAVVTVNEDVHGLVTMGKVPRLVKRYKKERQKEQ